MNSNISSDLLPRARQILLPLVATADEREALLTEAFYLHDPLLYAIDRNGAPKVFIVNCLKKLLDHGCLTDSEHSLARLLITARSDYGVDKHAEIDELITIANRICRSMPPDEALASNVVLSDGGPGSIQTISTPRDERRPTVFISYYHGDADQAEQLIAELTRAGHACWIDTSAIKGGDEWVQTIADGIINSYALIPLITSKALQSKWVKKEIIWAQQRKKLIIPWVLENVMHEPGFFPLVDCQGVTLFDRGFDAALQMLLRDLPTIETAEAPPNETISITHLHSAPRKLELAYLERLRLEELLNTEKYTPMGGTYQQKIQPAEMRAVFALMKFGKDRERQHETRRFENAVEEILNIRRAVLLGEPGGGKTTTIWKLAADLVETALQDRKASIPLLIRLGRWTDADQPLEDFIASQLGDLGAHLDLLLTEKRAALLLDGLNELPAGQHKEKYPQVQRFIEQHPKLLAVVSCRELDYTIDLGFDLINITPLDPLRIREFAGRYLGEETGEALFWKLAGETAKETHKMFMEQLGDKLAEPERVFWIESQIPDGIENDGWGWSKDKDWYWRNWIRNRETPSSLMILSRILTCS